MSEENKEVEFTLRETRNNFYEAIKKAHKVSPAMVGLGDIKDMFIAAGIDQLFEDYEVDVNIRMLEDDNDNYAGAMADLEAIVAAYRKRMPEDEWLNLNYPIVEKDE